MSENKYPIGGYAPGNYHNRCITCERSFFGDKRAVQCEPCAVASLEKFNALSPAEQEEVLKRNIEIWNGMFDNMGKTTDIKQKIFNILLNHTYANRTKAADELTELFEREAKSAGAVWPLFVVDKVTGERHEVNKIVYHPENEPEPHIWCDTWYGHHVIGKDCEWVKVQPAGTVWIKDVLKWSKEAIEFANKEFECPQHFVETWGNLYMNVLHAIDQALDEAHTTNNDHITAALRKFVSMHETGLLPNRFTYEEGKRALKQ